MPKFADEFAYNCRINYEPLCDCNFSLFCAFVRSFVNLNYSFFVRLWNVARINSNFIIEIFLITICVRIRFSLRAIKMPCFRHSHGFIQFFGSGLQPISNKFATPHHNFITSADGWGWKSQFQQFVLPAEHAKLFVTTEYIAWQKKELTADK